MKRGGIWTIAGGKDYAGKPRPVVVVQDDVFDATTSLTICAFTTSDVDAALFRPLVNPSTRNGLKSASRLMVDKITTLPRSKFGKRVGLLEQADVAALDLALLVFFGLAKTT